MIAAKLTLCRPDDDSTARRDYRHYRRDLEYDPRASRLNGARDC